MIDVTIEGVALRFETRAGLFSPTAIDRGTLAMLACVRFAPRDKVLDLGCGYGVIGVLAAHVVDPSSVFMVDNDPEAIACAARNLEANGVGGATLLLSDGFAALKETEFDKILCNPPYHADFSLAKNFIEKGFNRLTLGGALWMVTKRDTWYRNKLKSIFGGVRVHERDGYFVFEAMKRSHTYANRAQ